MALQHNYALQTFKPMRHSQDVPKLGLGNESTSQTWERVNESTQARAWERVNYALQTFKPMRHSQDVPTPQEGIRSWFLIKSTHAYQ